MLNLYLDKPMFSLILSCVDMDGNIGRCLDSLMIQTFPDFEIICVDGNSEDSKLSIIFANMERDARISLKRLSSDDIGYCLNAGYNECRGEYVLFLNGRDYFEPYLLNHIYEAILKNHSDMIIYASDLEDSSTGICEKAKWFEKRNLLPEDEPFNYKILKSPKFCWVEWWKEDCAYKKRLIDENRLFHLEKSAFNDIFFSITAFLSAREISVLDKVLAHHIVPGEKSLINEKNSNAGIFLDHLYFLYDFLNKNHLFETLKIDFQQYCKHTLKLYSENMPLNESCKLFTIWKDIYKICENI